MTFNQPDPARNGSKFGVCPTMFNGKMTRNHKIQGYLTVPYFQTNINKPNSQWLSLAIHLTSSTHLPLVTSCHYPSHDPSKSEFQWCRLRRWWKWASSHVLRLSWNWSCWATQPVCVCWSHPQKTILVKSSGFDHSKWRSKINVFIRSKINVIIRFKVKVRNHQQPWSRKAPDCTLEAVGDLPWHPPGSTHHFPNAYYDRQYAYIRHWTMVSGWCLILGGMLGEGIKIDTFISLFYGYRVIDAARRCLLKIWEVHWHGFFQLRVCKSLGQPQVMIDR